MASTKARNRANIKYAKKAYDKINITVKKGNRETVKNYCDSIGTSVNGFLNKLLSDNIPDFKV